MAARWTSGCPSFPTRAAAVKAAIALALVAPFLVPAAHAQERALSFTLRSRALQPGELVVVRVAAPPDTISVSLSAFGHDWPAYQLDDGAWHGLIGIDLDVRPGRYVVVARGTGSSVVQSRRTIVVQTKRFRRRTLRVAPEFVNPPLDVLGRIARDSDAMRAAYGRTATEAGWRAGFTRPVPDRANSSFGTRSVFNGEPRSPHAGTDFLSAEGTPVRAPSGGRVVLAGDLFFTGRTLVIDHGLGIFSMLAHLSRIDVEEGQEVTQATVVGLVGATGRVTGPHLHWALRAGPARVDPLSALALIASK